MSGSSTYQAQPGIPQGSPDLNSQSYAVGGLLLLTCQSITLSSNSSKYIVIGALQASKGSGLSTDSNDPHSPGVFISTASRASDTWAASLAVNSLLEGNPVRGSFGNVPTRSIAAWFNPANASSKSEISPRYRSSARYHTAPD